MRIIEKTLCILAVTGYIFILLFWTGGEMMTAFTLMGLCLLYLFLSFAILNGVRLRSVFKKAAYAGIPSMHITAAIVTGLVLAHTCFCLIFGTLLWMGHTELLVTAIVTCSIVVIVSIISRRRDIIYYNRILTRTITLMCICVVLVVFSPRNIALEIEYKNHPALIEAQEKSWADPLNAELRERARDEWRKTYQH
jgi:hypothetical protein